MNTVTLHKKQGASLILVMVTAVIITILIGGLSHLSSLHAVQTVRFEQSAQAFWLAEAGMNHAIANLADEGKPSLNEIIVPETALGTTGTYAVQVIDSDSTTSVLESIGTVQSGSDTVTRRILFSVDYVFPGFKEALWAGNNDDGTSWELQMGGDQYATGTDGPQEPVSQGTNFWGGSDVIIGNVNVNGSVRISDDSQIQELSGDFPGDLVCSGTLYTDDSNDADDCIAGTRSTSTSNNYDPPDLSSMEYDLNNDWDIAAEFELYGIASGRLPDDHPLADIVIKNPTSRSIENQSTDGDDYYFEPETITGSGTPATGSTPVSLGDDVTYYVNGNVWFHNKSTFGFQIEGQSLIVATGNIHISDNLSYADESEGGDLLVLVALGKLDANGKCTNYGNIYFGDPEYGTMYSVDAFMFANNNFLYNTSSTDGGQEQPESGFEVFGNYMAVNQVQILRDWYENDTTWLAAVYDPDGSDSNENGSIEEWEHWKDAESEEFLTLDQANSLRHYAMRVEYDARLLTADIHISNLPRGSGTDFADVVSWEEVSE